MCLAKDHLSEKETALSETTQHFQVNCVFLESADPLVKQSVDCLVMSLSVIIIVLGETHIHLLDYRGGGRRRWGLQSGFTDSFYVKQAWYDLFIN